MNEIKTNIKEQFPVLHVQLQKNRKGFVFNYSRHYCLSSWKISTNLIKLSVNCRSSTSGKYKMYFACWQEEKENET